MFAFADSSLTALTGQWDRHQSCKYTLEATFVIISQNFLIAHHKCFGRVTIARHNIKLVLWRAIAARVAFYSWPGLMTVAQAAENHGDEWGLTWYFLWEICTSISTWMHSQDSLAAAAEIPSLQASAYEKQGRATITRLVTNFMLQTCEKLHATTRLVDGWCATFQTSVAWNSWRDVWLLHALVYSF